MQFLSKADEFGNETLNATCGILFFAVPHRGMDVTDMMAACEYPGTSETRLVEVSIKSNWRRELDSFVDRIRAFNIASFYEMELTARLKQVRNTSIISEPLYFVNCYSNLTGRLHGMDL